MKLDNKGFAITSILYAVLVLFLSIIVAMLLMLGNRKLILDKYKQEVKNDLNSTAETYGARVQIADDTKFVRIYEEELMEYNFKSGISGCLNGGMPEENPDETLCSKTEQDITKLLNYNIYDDSGNEVLEFSTTAIYDISDYLTKVDVVKYTYYEKDSNGNYVLNQDGNSLKKVTADLAVNKENKFYVKYYVVDNKNIISKDNTRTLVILKYNNYIKLNASYFEVSLNQLKDTTVYNSNANVYKINEGYLDKDNTLLNYVIFDANDYQITKFDKTGDNTYYYNCEASACKENGSYINMPINVDDKFRIRYFTGEYNNPTSDIVYSYFIVK